MNEEKRIVIYHDTVTLARRARRPGPGETIGYRAIADWNDEENKSFDEVVDLSTAGKPKKGAGKNDIL